MRRSHSLLTIDLIPQPRQLHLFIFHFLRQLLNFNLRSPSVILVIGLRGDLFLSPFQVLSVISSKTCLNLIHLISKIFIFLLYFKEVLNSIVSHHDIVFPSGLDILCQPDMLGGGVKFCKCAAAIHLYMIL